MTIECEILPTGTWPESLEPGHACWYATLTDPMVTEPITNLSTWPFRWL